jgi:hypothetical protein
MQTRAVSAVPPMHNPIICSLPFSCAASNVIERILLRPDATEAVSEHIARFSGWVGVRVYVGQNPDDVRLYIIHFAGDFCSDYEKFCEMSFTHPRKWSLSDERTWRSIWLSLPVASNYNSMIYAVYICTSVIGVLWTPPPPRHHSHCNWSFPAESLNSHNFWTVADNWKIPTATYI